MDRQHWQKHAQMNREEGGRYGVGKVSGATGVLGSAEGGGGLGGVKATSTRCAQRRGRSRASTRLHTGRARGGEPC